MTQHLSFPLRHLLEQIKESCAFRKTDPHRQDVGNHAWNAAHFAPYTRCERQPKNHFLPTSKPMEIKRGGGFNHLRKTGAGSFSRGRKRGNELRRQITDLAKKSTGISPRLAGESDSIWTAGQSCQPIFTVTVKSAAAITFFFIT